MLDNIYILIICMAFVSYMTREIPFVILRGKKLNENVVEWLSYMPVSVLSALLVPGLLVDNGSINISFDNVFLLASIPTFIIGHMSKNLLLTIISGVIITAIIRHFS